MALDMTYFTQMEEKIPRGKVRTRFAPSPTGYMHVGNLRTALYTWLIARANNGTFILRIEDTDQGRLVEGAVDVIYRTMAECGLNHDEGPDVGGPVAPYIQSERRDTYGKYAELLVERAALTTASARRASPRRTAAISSVLPIPAATCLWKRPRPVLPPVSPMSSVSVSPPRAAPPSATPSSVTSRWKTPLWTIRSFSSATACPPTTSPMSSTII